jgi:ribonuclease BN (tRNA processing enzyme)
MEPMAEPADGTPVESTRAWVLGSGGWFPTDRRETTSILMRRGNHALLLDAGTGVRRLITDGGLLDGVIDIDIVLTHFHLDHVCGLLYLPALFSIIELTRPPGVWAPGEWLFGKPSEELLDPVFRAPLSPFPASVVEAVHELGPESHSIGPFTVTSLEQPRHWGPTAGLRVNDELVLITDTAREASHAEFAAGVTHVVHEAWSASSAPIFSNYDATGRDAARTAADAGADHLTLVHLNPLIGDLASVLADAAEEFRGARLGQDGHAIQLRDSGGT